MRLVVAARRRRFRHRAPRHGGQVAAMAWQALLVAALFLTPVWASAQDPETPPPPPPPPAERAVTRGEVRAPRGEARAPERVQENRNPQNGGEQVHRIPERAVERPVRAPRTEADESPSRREVVSVERTAPPPPITADAAASREEEQRGERRGAVRRPPPGDGSNRGGGDRAIPRAEAPPPPESRGRINRGGTYYPNYPTYSRYYDPWGYGAFGLGYYYSPWSWYPYGYGGYGSGSYGSYYPQYGGAYGFDVGNVKIKVKQRDAEVWVDGYYAGTVDDFDGIFQALRLDSGAYRIEIKKAGYETLTFDVRVQPERTITFRGDLKPVP